MEGTGTLAGPATSHDRVRKTISLQWAVFAAFFAVTFLVLYGWFLVLRRAYQPDLPDDHMMINGGQPLKLPVARILHLLGLVVSFVIAVITGSSVMMDWPTLALYWYAPGTTGGAVDPIFGKSMNFCLFTLPAWQFITGWLLALAVLACVIAAFFIFLTGSTRHSINELRQRGVGHRRDRTLAEVIIIQAKDAGIGSKAEFVCAVGPSEIVVDKETGGAPSLDPGVVQSSDRGERGIRAAALHNDGKGGKRLLKIGRLE
jgi:hypothetical protein